jgi:hypothetical protein
MKSLDNIFKVYVELIAKSENKTKLGTDQNKRMWYGLNSMHSSRNGPLLWPTGPYSVEAHPPAYQSQFKS